MSILDMEEEEYAKWFLEEYGHTVEEQMQINVKFEDSLNKLRGKVKDIGYAKDLYKALCNMKWKCKTTEIDYHCSWRYAGGLIADLRDVGECYLDFYCSGGEGHVTEEVKEDLDKLGWTPQEWD